MPARVRLTPILVSATAIFLGLAAGCTKNPAPRPGAKGAGATSANNPATIANSAASQRCQTLLSSALEMLRPEKLGISAEPKAAVDTLNNWVRDCGKTVAADTPPAHDPAVEKLISQSARAEASGDLYDRQDIEHVRDCWLFKQARGSVGGQYDSEASRTVALLRPGLSHGRAPRQVRTGGSPKSLRHCCDRKRHRRRSRLGLRRTPASDRYRRSDLEARHPKARSRAGAGSSVH